MDERTKYELFRRRMIMNKSRKLMLIILSLLMIVGHISQTYASTIRVTVTARVSRSTPKPYLDSKRIVIYKKCYDVLCLENASNKVSWSTTNKKIVRLKKHGNEVKIYWKRKGTCKVRATYKGKTYSCKIICKGICPNAVDVDSMDKTVYMVGERDFNDVTIYCYTDNTELFWDAENPEMVDCSFGEWFWNEDEYAWEIHLRTTALKPGITRLVITNSHNPTEIDYITVNNSGFYNGV